MVSRIVRKTRSTKYVTIPPEFCEELGLDEGSFVDISRIEKRIIIAPVQPAKTETSAATPSSNPGVA